MYKESRSTPVHSDAFWNKNRILRQMQQEVSIKPPFFAFDSGIKSKSGHLTCRTPHSNCEKIHVDPPKTMANLRLAMPKNLPFFSLVNIHLNYKKLPLMRTMVLEYLPTKL